MKNNKIYIVSGLPRSGTSMMMKALTSGELTPMVDEKRKADRDNPEGYFEYKPAMSLHKDNSWMGKVQGKLIKIMVNFLEYLPDDFEYEIVLMRRDLAEILKSQQKMLGKDEESVDVAVEKIFRKDIKKARKLARQKSNIRMIEIWYPEVIENPRREMKKIAEFIGYDLNVEKMVETVDPKLYRNRLSQSK